MTTSLSWDEPSLRRVVEHANLNVLRLAVYQVTRDPELAKMKVQPTPVRGGAFTAYLLAPEHHEEVKEKAVNYLLSQPCASETPLPDEAELSQMMALLTGKELTEEEFSFGREELALDEFPREATWRSGPPDGAGEFKIVIVGAGASGIAAAIQFERLGLNYTVYERQSDIGGTWNLNDYPDARVDTTSYLYQFKFEKNYPWTEYFASQPEVKSYLEFVAKKHNVYQKIRFDTEVTSAKYDGDIDTWRLLVSDAASGEYQVDANALISAAGMFSTPKFPDIEGIDDFEGRLFHTTSWNGNFDYNGTRVAVVGNGSTGVQVMPRIAEEARQIYAFVRTPQWISPMEGYKDNITPENRWLLDNVPFYWNWFCYNAQVTSSSMQDAQVYDHTWRQQGGGISQRNDGLREALTEYIASQVGRDSELFEQLVPDYAPLARRLVVDNGWYRALLKDNVDLVTEGIEAIEATGIRDSTGKLHEVDAIVFASGFQVTKYLWPTEYIGRDGTKMEEMWEKDGPRAYLGLTVPKFPNLFIFYGPNSQPRAGAFLSWIEIWARYSAQAVVDLLEHGGRAMEVHEQVFLDYNERLDEETGKLIWENEGPVGKNYYVNKHGRQNVNLPWRNEHYFTMVAAPDLSDYEVW